MIMMVRSDKPSGRNRRWTCWPVGRGVLTGRGYDITVIEREELQGGPGWATVMTSPLKPGPRCSRCRT